MKKAIAIGAWCLYDWAMTPFGAVISTFVFAVYFSRAVAESEVAGTAHWSRAIALAGIAVAVLSPLLGAIADRTGRRLPWICGFTLLGVAATATLWFVRPDPASIPLALVAVAVATVAIELATVFYNAMLGSLAPKGWVGRLSGWGWATGYFGSILCLLIALFGLVQAEQAPFGLWSTEDQGNVRATALLTAAWYAVFALPLFLLTPDAPSTGVPIRRAIGDGLKALAETVRAARREGNVLRFLIASAIYRDGLNTLFSFGGLYAATVFGMGFEDLVIFAVLLNVSAALGAIGFAFLDDRIGARPTILISLAGLIATGLPLLVIEDRGWFWAIAILLGTFIGPAQAAGRSLLTRLTPPDTLAEMFGLYNLTGKAVSFVGPLLFGFATEIFATPRAGMATVVLFFAIGMAVMLSVQEPKPVRIAKGP